MRGSWSHWLLKAVFLAVFVATKWASSVQRCDAAHALAWKGHLCAIQNIYRSGQTIANWCQVLVSKKESNVRMKQVSDQKKKLHQSHPVFRDFSDSCVNHCSGVGVLLLTDPLGVCRAAWYLGKKVRICPISSMPWYSQAKLNTIFTVLIHVAFYRNMILSSGEDLMEAQLCLACFSVICLKCHNFAVTNTVSQWQYWCCSQYSVRASYIIWYLSIMIIWHYETMVETVDEVHNLWDIADPQGLGAADGSLNFWLKLGGLPTGAVRKPSPLHPLEPLVPILHDCHKITCISIITFPPSTPQG